ncbi:hypothetical protein BH23ACT11_BH23ACT11_13740 [soil metagenome]
MSTRKIIALFRLVSALAAGTLRSPVLWALVVVFGVALAVADEREVHAQEEQVEGALLLIMDASGSMNREDDDGTRLIDGAKDALNKVVDALPEGTPVGLRVYGHRVPNTDRARGCQDTELIQSIASLDRQEMKDSIAGFEAKGFTPIGLSLQEAADDLPPEGPRTIVLVSDGEDTCAPPPPCEVARDLIAEGIDVKVETVGFFIQDNQQAQSQLQCIADATGGSYHSADSAGELVEELETISARAVRSFEAGGEEVTGGPSAGDAPVLEPGAYQDTILPNESLWYGVELEEGEELILLTTLGGFPGVDERSTGRRLKVQLVTPALEDFSVLEDGYGKADGAGRTAVNTRVRSGVVDPAAAEEDPNYDATEPGTYYARVTFEDFFDDLEAREFPLELTFEVAGEEEETTSEPTVEEAGPEEDTEAEEPTEDTDPQDQAPNGPDEPEEPAETEQASEESGNIANTLLVFFSGMLAVLVVGLAIALFVVMRRRA